MALLSRIGPPSYARSKYAWPALCQMPDSLLYSLFSIIILEAICPFSAELNNALINTLSAHMIHIYPKHDILHT